MKLRKNIIWMIIGNTVYAGSQWLLLVIMAKLTNTLVVGQYAMSLAITAPVFSFSNLQLRGIQATDVNNRYDFSEYFSLRFVSSVVALLFIACYVVVADNDIETCLIVILVAVSKAVESISDICYGLMQKHEELSAVASSMMIKGVFTVFAIGMVAVYFQSMVAISLSLIIVWSFLLIFYDLIIVYKLTKKNNNRDKSIIKFKTNVLMKMLCVTVPMGFVISLSSLNFNIPKYVILEFYNEQMLGFYTAITCFLVIGSTVVSAVGQAASPRLAKYYIINRRYFTVLLFKLILFVLLIGMSAVLVSFYYGSDILRIVYTNDYSVYNELFVWTMISGAVFYCVSILGCAITATKCYNKQAISSVIVVFVIAYSSWELVPTHGLVGAVYSMTIGFVVNMLIFIILLYFIVRCKKQI